MSFGPGGNVDLLPLYAVSRLIGRQREAEEIRGLLEMPDVRLLTLVGVGGVGKTRLAIEVVRQLRGDLDTEVYVVQLAALDDPDQVFTTIARALGVNELANQPILEALQAALRDQRLTLVLDNFEHVVAAAGELGVLLTGCSHLKVLATSRTPLHLRGERTYVVQPFAVPRAADDIDTLAANEAIALFVERARAALPDFELTAENAAAVAAICARLDGLPLALELAAARVKLLSTAELLTRLDHSLTFLKDANRDTPQRQQTLRNTISWSYDLLTPEQQTVLRRLAVFPDGWTLTAAEALIANDNEALDILDALDVLVDHNLVRRRPQAPDARFEMLETIAEFAHDQLEASGEAGPLRHRHMAWVLQVGDDLKAFRGWQLLVQPVAPQPTYADMRAAFAWATEHGDPEQHLELAAALYSFRFQDLTMSDLRALTGGALDRSPHIKTLIRCDALWNAAYGAHMQGADSDAIALLQEGIAVARPFGQTFQLGATLLLLGQIRQEQEDFSEATTLFEEALSIANVVGNNSFVGLLHFFMALVASGLGQHQRAIELATNAVSTIRDADGSPHLIANAVEMQGTVLAVAGCHAQAAATLRDSYLAFIEVGEHTMAPLALAGLSYVAQCLGHAIDAAVLAGSVDAFCQRFNFVLFMPERQLYKRATSLARATLGDAAFQDAFELGRTLSFEDTVSMAHGIADPQRVPTWIEQASRQRNTTRLSPRELDVLRLITEGKPDREIAAALSISPRTVTTHVTNILNKLGVSSRSAAAAYAARHDLV